MTGRRLYSVVVDNCGGCPNLVSKSGPINKQVYYCGAVAEMGDVGMLKPGFVHHTIPDWCPLPPDEDDDEDDDRAEAELYGLADRDRESHT